jgi:hypothetical protein
MGLIEVTAGGMGGRKGANIKSLITSHKDEFKIITVRTY